MTGKDRRKEPRDSSAGRAAWWPFLLVAATLITLVVGPSTLNREIDRRQEQLDSLLVAQGRVADLRLIFSEQNAALQLYLLRGETLARAQFVQLGNRATELFDESEGAMTSLDFGDDGIGVEYLLAREAQASLWDTWQIWVRANARARLTEEGRAAYLPSFYLDQLLYQETAQAARILDAAIQRVVDRTRFTANGIRDFQQSLTLVLVALALGGTLALGVIGRRLREVVTESDQRRADALRARREVTAVMEASGDGVVGLDLEGRCNNLNQTGSSLLGISEVDARGRTIHELLHGKAPPEDRHPPEACPLFDALDFGKLVEDGQAMVWRRNGSAFPARWQVRPRIDGKEVKGAVVTITDMTEIREAEEALRKAVHARDEMVAIVSHDLRSPLGTISAASDLLIDLDLPPDKVEEQLRIIRRQSDRMANLIRDLLDVARIEAGALSVHPTTVPIEPVVRETIEQFAPEAEELGIDLRVELDPVPDVLAESRRLEQVLSNLVGNALRFTPSGGTVELGATEQDGQVCLTVRDTGTGIVPEALEHLFDRFWQPEQGGNGGTGLGLTIVRGIVEAHGGSVRVESEVGQGSTFFVLLPRASDPVDASVAEAPAAG